MNYIESLFSLAFPPGVDTILYTGFDLMVSSLLYSWECVSNILLINCTRQNREVSWILCFSDGCISNSIDARWGCCTQGVLVGWGHFAYWTAGVDESCYWSGWGLGVYGILAEGASRCQAARLEIWILFWLLDHTIAWSLGWKQAMIRAAILLMYAVDWEIVGYLPFER